MDVEQDMSDEERLSAAGHRSRATRWRRLAGEATTPRAKKHLLSLARESDALAGGDGIVARPDGRPSGTWRGGPSE
jgi:hypothetical protein